MPMLRSRMLWKIYSVFATFILLSALLVGGLLGRHIAKNKLADIQAALQTRSLLLAELAAPHFAEPPARKLQKTIVSLGKKTHTRMTVINAQGVVLADSDKDPLTMDNHGQRPEVLESRFHDFGQAIRFSKTLQTRMMYLARSVHKSGHFLGYVRTSLPLIIVDQRLAEVRKTIMMGVSLVTLISLLLGFFLARHFTRPLTAMTEMAEAMAQGNFGKRLSVKRKDEIGRLEKALNKMAEKSQQRLAIINMDRNKLSAILSCMSEGVIAINKDELIIHINDAAATLLGIDIDNSLNKPIWETTRIHDISKILTDTARDLKIIKRSVKIAYGTHDRIIEMHAAPLQDGIGSAVGAMVVLMDVSELRHLETVRRDFVANASHELKTPITAIRALVETLLDDREISPKKQQIFLEKIKNQSLRISAIVTDLLALSRFELRDESLAEEPVNLAEVTRKTLEDLSLSAIEKQITIELSVPETPLIITGGWDALEQAVSNLLDNAIKYTPEQGHIWLRCFGKDHEAVIEVRDTGIGIEPQDQERIFERFYRVDKARSRELGGTGLGLSIVRHIVMAHGGRVEVKSIPGSGSTFQLIFPLDEN
jgi:two-component system phosphate regulon sensor histidine kinase PhoR